MKLSNSPPIESSSHHPENRPRKVVAAACLVVSLILHIAAVVAVLLATTQQGYGPKVTYIDIDSIADSVPPAAPVTQPPAAHPEIAKAPQPVVLPENPPDSAKTEAPADIAKPPVAEALATSLGRGMASGYFSSIGEGRTLRDDIREYYFVLLEKINGKWWLKAEILKETAKNDGVILFFIGRDGTLIDLQLTKSTGSREVDRAIVEVLKEMSPFPPLPASYVQNTFRAPLKIAAPLHLFSVRSLR